MKKKLCNEKILRISVCIIGVFLITEVICGVIANSLALLADAGHMLSDFLALLLSLIAHKYSNKPADNQKSYGYGRMQIIASFVNGISLIGISIVVIIMAIFRFMEPPEIKSDVMLIAACVGVVVNSITLIMLHSSDDKNLNIRGAILHILGDLLGFIAAAVGALIIKMTNFYMVDPILSVIISCLILNSAYRLIRDSMHILMEGTPAMLAPHDVKKSLMQVDGVIDVQHIHLWLLTDSYTLLTLHLILHHNTDPFSAISDAKKILLDDFSIAHSTIAVEKYDSTYHMQCDYNHHHIK